MADMTLACGSVIVTNPPAPDFVIEPPAPQVVEISTPETLVEVINPPMIRVVSTPPLSKNIVLPVAGPPGPAGSGGGGAYLADQDIQESPDGVREVFTSSIPFIPNSLMVFLNGLFETNIIRLSTTSFQFTTPPEPGDVIKLSFSPA